MNRLGLEMLSGMGLPPVALVHLAADLGCAHVSLGPCQMPAQFNPLGHPNWSLKDDPAYARELKAALTDRGVSVSLGEGFAVRPGVVMAERGAEMDMFAELGTRGLGAVSMEPDSARALDEFATLAEMAHERGMLATIEFAPIQVVNSLEAALAVVHYVNRANFGLLLDAMHFFRTGTTLEALAAVDPALIRYAQLCDAPAGGPGDNYLHEAMFARRAQGLGELPLAAFVAALPPDIPLGLEVPNLAAAQAGETDHERLGKVVAAARALVP
jgi:sugar phosphate isomerase/epimerase